MTDVDIIEAEWRSVDVGADLLDSDDVVIGDLSADLIPSGSAVSRAIYGTIHGTCQLRLSREIDWGSQRVRPWMKITNAAGDSLQRNLGVYLLTTPSRSAGETPTTFTAKGFDKLEVLNRPYGATFILPVGVPILGFVAALIELAGETSWILDRTSWSKINPTLRVWPIGDRAYTLHIINDLLAMVGYRGLWVDRDGVYRSEPYVASSSIGPMWTYSPQSPTTSVAPRRVEQIDYYGVPNRWVFVRDNPAQSVPTLDDGMYVVVNQSDGPTSVDARGRVINDVVKLNAADQAALIVQGDRHAERVSRLDRRVELSTLPNPLHGHFDVVDYVDSDLGPSSRMLVTEWTLPFDGSDMPLKLKEV